jgi:prepilin peptidase CpaA
MIDALVTYAVVGLALVACVTDLRTRRIPNVLTFGGAAAAIVFHTATQGVSGLQLSVFGWMVGVAIFLPFFMLRGMGGGDVKLLAALGAWLGPREAFWLAIYASLAGGAIGIVVALASGYLGTALRNLRTLLTTWFLVGPQPVPSMTLEDSKGPRVAYAIPMFVGVMVTLWRR